MRRAILMLALGVMAEAFIQGGAYTSRRVSSLQLLEMADKVLYQDDDDKILYSDDNNNDEKGSARVNTRWNSLSPSVKEKIRKEGQERAIRNKEKRESAADKKRKMMFYYKDMERKAKRSSRVTRPLPTNSPARVKLSSLSIGDARNGTVISLTDFGAYIDVGSECDGLLHVSQITRKQFVEHPRQVLSPGDEVEVKVSRLSPGLKKMHVTMLSEEEQQSEILDEDDGEDRIPLDDLSINDELWGEIKRVTAYGGYVELGTAVQGWLHFMDHPEFVHGATPKEFMNVGDRIRCWVANVDLDSNRIKLTAIRPEDLPGPRRELKKF